MRSTWQVETCPVDHSDAQQLLLAYFGEMVQTYHRRPVTSAEVRAAMAEDPSDELSPPHGLFLVARRDGRLAGCLGLRHLGPGAAKLTRMFIAREARGCGGGTALITAMEARAAQQGVTTMRLSTRHDLVAARALYTRLGYREVAPTWESAYDDHWFCKRLDSATSAPADAAAG